MADREKVIKGLHQHCEGSLFDRCGECPYYAVSNEQFSCRDRLLEDALALLKEQEAKKVNISQTHCGMKYGLCPRCEKQIDTLVNPQDGGKCGQAVMW